MAWCQVGTSPSAGKTIILEDVGPFERLEAPTLRFQKVGNSQILGLVKRTPGPLQACGSYLQHIQRRSNIGTFETSIDLHPATKRSLYDTTCQLAKWYA